VVRFGPVWFGGGCCAGLGKCCLSHIPFTLYVAHELLWVSPFVLLVFM